jgi:hypothetical protein
MSKRLLSLYCAARLIVLQFVAKCCVRLARVAINIAARLVDWSEAAERWQSTTSYVWCQSPDGTASIISLHGSSAPPLAFKSSVVSPATPRKPKPKTLKGGRTVRRSKRGEL